MIYQYLRQILPVIKNPTVLELGAHIGTDTVKLLKLVNNPRLYLAVEPDYRNIAKLRELRQLNNLSFDIMIAAIAAKSGNRTLYLSDGLTEQGRQYTDGSSILRPAAKALSTGYTWQHEINTFAISLDDLYRWYHIDTIDFIWADIQGAELEMVTGGQVALENTYYLYTEYWKDLYHGSPGRDEILMALPGRWDIVFDNGTDILVKNGRY